MRNLKYAVVYMTVAILVASAGQVQAGVIVGGGGLLTSGDATQLETWLGEGPLQFNNIFTKSVGDTSADFHAATDGMGRTFSIIEVIGNAGDPNFSGPVIIGGYNPESWDDIGGYNFSPVGSRDAFIFNLTTSELRLQNPTDLRGQYQTVNASGYGPTFGGGFDIYVNDTLSSGYNSSYSYGTQVGGITIGGSQGIAGTNTNTFGSNTLTYGRIEVYTISPAAVTPEPTSMALFGLGSLGIGVIARRRKRKQLELSA